MTNSPTLLNNFYITVLFVPETSTIVTQVPTAVMSQQPIIYKV